MNLGFEVTSARTASTRKCQSCGATIQVQLGQDFAKDHKDGCPEQPDYPGRPSYPRPGKGLGSEWASKRSAADSDYGDDWSDIDWQNYAAGFDQGAAGHPLGHDTGDDGLGHGQPFQDGHYDGTLIHGGHAAMTASFRFTAQQVGYYVVSRNGTPISGPYATRSDAAPNMIEQRGAAVMFIGPGNTAEWDALKAKQFPVGTNTVNGAKTDGGDNSVGHCPNCNSRHTWVTHGELAPDQKPGDKMCANCFHHWGSFHTALSEDEQMFADQQKVNHEMGNHQVKVMGCSLCRTTSSRRIAAQGDDDRHETCRTCGVSMVGDDPDLIDGECPDCADPYSDSKRNASRHTAENFGDQYYDPNGKPCSQCGRGMNSLSEFPGDRCISCHANSPEGRAMPTADELSRMWGGPGTARHASWDDEEDPWAGEPLPILPRTAAGPHKFREDPNWGDETGCLICGKSKGEEGHTDRDEATSGRTGSMQARYADSQRFASLRHFAEIATEDCPVCGAPAGEAHGESEDPETHKWSVTCDNSQFGKHGTYHFADDEDSACPNCGKQTQAWLAGSRGSCSECGWKKTSFRHFADEIDEAEDWEKQPKGLTDQVNNGLAPAPELQQPTR